MIDKEGNARIMDFGIARSLTAKGITGAGVMIGTPEYMSPEQAEVKDVDQRSDIYSLGVILYEMVTGRVPFEGETPLGIAMKHKSEMPKNPKELNAQIPDDLSRVILRCMEKDKEKRYQSPGEVRSELTRIEKGIPTTEKVVPRKESITSKEITVSFSLKKLFIPALVVIALIAAAIIIWQLLPKEEAVLAPKIENSIAVISFENQTGDKAYDYLQKAIPALLITSLENTGYLHVVTWERMRDLLKQLRKKDVEIIDRDLGFELCSKEGIKNIVLGSFIKAGDIFATDVKVLEVESKMLLKSTSSKGKGVESILEKQIDELSREISLGIGITKQRIEAAQSRIGDVTTTSMEAYNYFLRGKLDLDSWYFNDARRFFEKAVELDPDFASAYRWLGKTYFFLGDSNAGIKAIEKARALSEKATERERLYIEAAYARRIENNEEKYIEILKLMAKKYPKEKLVHYYLGVYYGFVSKKLYSKAIEEFNKALELDPQWGNAYDDLGLIYIMLWELDKALECFNNYASIMPGEADPIASFSSLYFHMGKLDAAIAKFKEVLEIKHDFSNEYVIAYFYAMKEDYSETMKWIDQFISKAPSTGKKSEGYLWKGLYHYWLGSLDQSISDFTRAAELAEEVGNISIQMQSERIKGWIYYERGKLELSLEHFKRWFNLYKDYVSQAMLANVSNSFYLGLVELKQGRINSAKSRLDEIKSIIPKLDPRDKEVMIYRQDYLSGEVFLAEKSFDKAISILEKSKPLQEPHLWNTGSIIYNIANPKGILARAYLQNEELDKAIAEYERLITFDPNSKSKHLVNPRDYYKVAKLYEEKGQKAKAIEHYEKFLSLWKDADPGIAEVEDAKKRLAGLKSQ
jgi:tetratricopeptide (TPR) repeat protein